MISDKLSNKIDDVICGFSCNKTGLRKGTTPMRISFNIDDEELLPLLGNPNPHEDAKYIVTVELRKRMLWPANFAQMAPTKNPEAEPHE